MSALIHRVTDAMRDAGMEPADPTRIRLDGVLCRFDCVGDKTGKRNAWAVVFTTGARPVATFGHWARDIHESVCIGNGAKLTATEREQARMAVDAAQRQRDADIERLRVKARHRAARDWADASPAPAAHPYLTAKGVQPHGLRVSGLSLLVPLRDIDGNLHSLQFIRADGKKRFMRGGRIHGCFARIGHHGDHFIICEGFATGASLHEATGLPVAVALAAGNMRNVAEALRGKYPEARLTIAADNDEKPDGSNPGVEAARAAAARVGGYVAIPPQTGDFNDYLAGNSGDFTLSED